MADVGGDIHQHWQYQSDLIVSEASRKIFSFQSLLYGSCVSRSMNFSNGNTGSLTCINYHKLYKITILYEMSCNQF